MTGSSGPVKPVWDRGDDIDAEMFAFTVGDDWAMDRRLVAHDIQGSLAHVAGLREAGLVSEEDAAAIDRGLRDLLESWQRGEWNVDAVDEDVHSAVERRLIAAIGEPGKRLHTARSRNEQIALDVRLWLRESIAAVDALLAQVDAACRSLAARSGALPLPGYTHLRRAMPSTLAHWIGAFAQAFALDRGDLARAGARLETCPLGSGAGYGLPVDLPRDATAKRLAFAAADEPVTHVQLSRGRAELAYVTALESIALDVAKLATDLWLFTTDEFGFAKLPVQLTTGSSLMPQKRNPDLLELMRAHSRQVVADRAALLDVIRDLPSGYHRDFQLLKGPLFRAHDRVVAMLPLLARLIESVTFVEEKMRAACSDPAMQATARAMEKVKRGVPFRDAYREEAGG